MMLQRVRRGFLLVLACCLVMVLPAEAAGYVPFQTAKTQVVGGKAVPFADAPWAVVMFDTSRPDPVNAVFCGGVLLDSRWVLTAAHCVYRLDEATNKCALVGVDSFRIGYGSTDIGTRMSIMVAEKLIKHDAYDCRAPHDDIALIRLYEPVDGTHPIRLPSDADAAKFLRNDAWVEVSGWGATRERGWNSRELLEVDIPITSLATCVTNYGADAVPADAICAGGREGKDSCTGDSGGPMYVNKGKDAIALGVVSRGEGCGRANRPGIYAPVLPYKPWIAKVMSTPCVPSTKEPFTC